MLLDRVGLVFLLLPAGGIEDEELFDWP